MVRKLYNCVKKARFETYEKASAAAKRIRQNSGTHLHAYGCDVCLKFHLTSQAPRTNQLPPPVKAKSQIDGRQVIKQDDDFYYVALTKRNKYRLINKGWEALPDEGLARRPIRDCRLQ